MKRLIVGLFVLMMIVPAFAQQNVGFGFTLSGEGSGIFFMIPSKSRINPEIITAGSISEDYYDLRLGARVLYDLGQKGLVSRYTGLGGGVNVESRYNHVSDTYDANTTFWGQLVLGTKVSLRESFLKAPVKIRSEVGLSVNDITARTHIGFGVEYEF